MDSFWIISQIIASFIEKNDKNICEDESQPVQKQHNVRYNSIPNFLNIGKQYTTSIARQYDYIYRRMVKKRIKQSCL